MIFRLQQRSLNSSRPDQHCGHCYKYPPSLLHKGSRVTFPSHPFCLCLLVSFFGHFRDKDSQPDNDHTKELFLSKNNIQQGAIERVAAAKNSVPEARQSAPAAGSHTRYCHPKSLTGHLHVLLRARQTNRATVAMELHADKACRDLFFRRIDHLVIRESFIPSEIPSPAGPDNDFHHHCPPWTISRRLWS